METQNMCFRVIQLYNYDAWCGITLLGNIYVSQTETVNNIE